MHRRCFCCGLERLGDWLIGIKYCSGCAHSNGISRYDRPFVFDFLYLADSTVFAPLPVIRDRMRGWIAQTMRDITTAKKAG